MEATDEQKRDRLIQGLVCDLQPVTPARPGRAFAVCLAVQAAVVALAAYGAGIRPDIAGRIADPAFLLVVGVLAVAAAWCASVALRLSIPGRDVDDTASSLLLATPAALAVLVLVARPWGSAWSGWSGLAGCLPCIGVTAASALVPWLAVLFFVSRLAPLNVLRTGMFAGLSALLVGALITELHCPEGSSYHRAFGHYLPVLVLSALACIAAAAILRSRLRLPALEAAEE